MRCFTKPVEVQAWQVLDVMREVPPELQWLIDDYSMTVNDRGVLLDTNDGDRTVGYGRDWIIWSDANGVEIVPHNEFDANFEVAT
jgi:hypothetical protein